MTTSKSKNVLVSIPISPELRKVYTPFSKAMGVPIDKIMEAVLIVRIMEIVGIANEFIEKGAKKL